YDLAWNLAGESLDLYRTLNYRHGIASELIQLGDIAGARGEYRQARSLYREALTHARALGSENLIGAAIRGLATLATVQEPPEQAALLFGIADNISAAPAGDIRAAILSTTRISARMHDRSLESIYGRGRALPPAEGISIALHDELTGE